MNLTPLGWSRSHVLYLVANATHTGIYKASERGPSFISTLVSQPTTSGVLSPDGRWIAFGVPASCYYCTLYVYDLATLTIWNGPSGVPGEYALAWTSDSRWIVAPLGKHLALISPTTHDQSLYRLPRDLNHNWGDPMRAKAHGGSLTITDSTSGRVYNLQPVSGHR
jgi:hypothetical protein